MPRTNSFLLVGAVLAALPAAAMQVPVPVGEAGVGAGGSAGSGAVVGSIGQNSGLGSRSIGTYYNPALGSNLPGMTGVGPSIRVSPAAIPVSGPGGVRGVVPTYNGVSPASRNAASVVPGNSVAPFLQANEAKSPPARGILPGTNETTPGAKLSQVDKLGKTVRGIDKDRALESQGRKGDISGKLDSLFDFSAKKGAGALGVPEAGGGAAVVSGLPDPKVVGAARALNKVRTLARDANPADAPFLYSHAVGIADEFLEGGEARGEKAAMLREASAKAPAALPGLGRAALAAAAKGRTTEALRYTKSVHEWNRLLSGPQGDYIANFAQFSRGVKQVLAAALDSPGKALPAPNVRFEPAGGKAGSSRVKAVLNISDAIENEVAAVPADLVAIVALAGADKIVSFEDLSIPRGPALHAAFGLTPQAGFRRFYKTQRAMGRSIWTSFWIAARQYISAVRSTLWNAVRSWVLSVLQRLGVIGGAGNLRVRVSDSNLADLRSAEPSAIAVEASEAGLKPDSFGLGYKLIIP